MDHPNIRKGFAVGSMVGLLAFVSIWVVHSCRPEAKIKTPPDKVAITESQSAPSIPALGLDPKSPDPTATAPTTVISPIVPIDPKARCYLLLITSESATLKPINCSVRVT